MYGYFFLNHSPHKSLNSLNYNSISLALYMYVCKWVSMQVSNLAQKKSKQNIESEEMYIFICVSDGWLGRWYVMVCCGVHTIYCRHDTNAIEPPAGDSNASEVWISNVLYKRFQNSFLTLFF
jgi:hypothetical protein